MWNTSDLPPAWLMNASFEKMKTRVGGGVGWGGVGSGGYALGEKKKLVTLTEAPLCKLTTPPVKSSIFNMLYISKK